MLIPLIKDWAKDCSKILHGVLLSNQWGLRVDLNKKSVGDSIHKCNLHQWDHDSLIIFEYFWALIQLPTFLLIKQTPTFESDLIINTHVSHSNS